MVSGWMWEQGFLGQVTPKAVTSLEPRVCMVSQSKEQCGAEGSFKTGAASWLCPLLAMERGHVSQPL